MFCRTPADVFDDASARTSGHNGKYFRVRQPSVPPEVEQHALEKQVQHLDQRMSIIERRAQIQPFWATSLRNRWSGELALPGSRRFPAQPGRVRALLLQRTSGAQLRVEREIDDLAEKDQRQWANRPVAGVPFLPRIYSVIDAAELSHLQTRLIDTLRESDRVTTQLLHASKKAEARLKQLLFLDSCPVGASSWGSVAFACVDGFGR